MVQHMPSQATNNMWFTKLYFVQEYKLRNRANDRFYVLRVFGTSFNIIVRVPDRIYNRIILEETIRD